MKRILITGSRTWPEPRQVEAAIMMWVSANVPEGETSIVVHGDCPKGADYFAKRFALNQWWLEHEAHPADWEGRGKSAGFDRNREMVEIGADVCLAFIHNKSKGATNTAELAEAAGIPTRRIEIDDEQ